MNVYANGLGHMTKMAAMFIYHGKLLQSQRANSLGTWYVVLRMNGLPSLTSVYLNKMFLVATWPIQLKFDVGIH